MARPLDVRREHDGAGRVVRIIVRAPAGQVIDEVILVRGPRKWRTVIGLVKASPPRRSNGGTNAFGAR
jgi:hypothetical protein